MTHAVASGLMAEGGVLVTCDTRRLPVGMMMPVIGHQQQVPRFAIQAAAGRPVLKRTWKAIVQTKIRHQAFVLNDAIGDDRGLPALADRVRSGDPQNVEATAARRYWGALFGEQPFRRDRDADDCNALLNYGYAVLRAIVARSICGVGLHPSLGIHHHNRESGYPLADDLMEPFRPLVDRIVLSMQNDPPDEWCDADSRQRMLESLTDRFVAGGESRTLFDWSSKLATNLWHCLSGEARTLIVPAFGGDG